MIDLSQRFLMAREHRQQHRVELMGGRVVRSESDGATVRHFGGRPVPFEESVDLSERDVGFRGCIVQRERAFGGSAR